MASNYEHKLTREYSRTPQKAEGGAHFFKPMLAHKFEPGHFVPGYAQPKLDGVRCITTAAGMFSREGKPILGAPHIHDALAHLFAEDPDLVLDGEIYNHDLKDDFNTIVSVVKKQSPTPAQLERSAELAQYHIYDVPSQPGDFFTRIQSLLDMDVNLHMGVLQMVDTYPVTTLETFLKLHETHLALGYEGTMWRRNAPYEQKRSKHLLKHKEFQDAEFEVVAIEEGNGNWAGLAKRVTCRLPDGRTFGAGIKGDAVQAKRLLTETHKVATVRFFALTPDGIPRFPVATKFWGQERSL